jgi:hypothetical protein
MMSIAHWRISPGTSRVGKSLVAKPITIKSQYVFHNLKSLNSFDVDNISHHFSLSL